MDIRISQHASHCKFANDNDLPNRQKKRSTTLNSQPESISFTVRRWHVSDAIAEFGQMLLNSQNMPPKPANDNVIFSNRRCIRVGIYFQHAHPMLENDTGKQNVAPHSSSAPSSPKKHDKDAEPSALAPPMHKFQKTLFHMEIRHFSIKNKSLQNGIFCARLILAIVLEATMTISQSQKNGTQDQGNESAALPKANSDAAGGADSGKPMGQRRLS